MDFPGGDDFRGRGHALQVAKRCQQGHLLDEAYDLGPQRPAFPRIAQEAQFPDLHAGHDGADDGAHHLLHAAPHLHGGGRLDGFFQKRADVFKGHCFRSCVPRLFPINGIPPVLRREALR